MYVPWMYKIVYPPWYVHKERSHRNRRDIEWYFVFVVLARRSLVSEIFICAIKNHHLISELPASKYTSITTMSLSGVKVDEVFKWR